MTLIEFLDDPIFLYPQLTGDLRLQHYLKIQFEQYHKLIQTISETHILNDLAPQLKNIKSASDNLLLTIESYLQGHLPSAYKSFEKAMETFKPFLLLDNNGGMAKEYLFARPYFRARIGTKKFTKGEMFHVPFSKRAYANTHRFSIPGLPCLYLSNCIYTCWEELDRPDFASLQVAQFRQINLDLKILNLSLTPERLQKQLMAFPVSRFNANEPYHDLSISLLVNWPLIMASSLQVSEPNAPFKQEYIIPQLLMQWVMEQSDVDGIQYFSNKSISHNRNDFSKFINYVFPPKKMDQYEYCEDLCKSFILTQPVTFKFIQAQDPNESYMGNINYKVAAENQYLEYKTGLREKYDTTGFGKMENFLLSQVPGAIDPKDYSPIF
jgi:hypothetical protein